MEHPEAPPQTEVDKDDDLSKKIYKDWFTTAEGRKYLHLVQSLKDQVGILDDTSIPNTLLPDRREIKIVVYGKAGVGKTSVIANLCGLEIPSSHVETTGIQVIGSFWPVQLQNNKIVLFKYKFWDCGATGIKKYTYVAQACNVGEPHAVIFVFSLTDRESYEDFR